MNIGIEIESPFSFYFPELNQKWFSTKKYYIFNGEEINQFTKEVSLAELEVKEKLTNLSNKLGLARGKDRYWEFIFPPRNDIQHHISDMETLISENLIPIDKELSTHFTIGNISNDKAFAILFFLELKYISKERIMSGFTEISCHRAWNRRGLAGIRRRLPCELSVDASALELRTIKPQMKDFSEVMNYLSLLSKDNTIVQKAKTLVKEMGLPWAAWNEKEFLQYSEQLLEFRNSKDFS